MENKCNFLTFLLHINATFVENKCNFLTFLLQKKTFPKQRKDDYLSSLNRLKEKAIRSKFLLNMTNDMIALTSNWGDRLWPPNCDKKEDPQVWATPFPHLLTLTQKEKKLNPKAMITYKRPTTIRQKLTNYKDLALNKIRK